MTPSHDTHLTYDDMLRALVDRNDLGVDARAHLDSCPRCQSQVRRLAGRYERMGQMARSLAPAPAGPFRVPDQRTFGVRWQFKSALAVGLAGTLVFFFTVLWPHYFDSPDSLQTEFAQGGDTETRLMAQIDALVQDALPEGYQALAMGTDSDITDLSEDLIDWIVPSIEENAEESDPLV